MYHSAAPNTAPRFLLWILDQKTFKGTDLECTYGIRHFVGRRCWWKRRITPHRAAESTQRNPLGCSALFITDAWRQLTLFSLSGWSCCSVCLQVYFSRCWGTQKEIYIAHKRAKDGGTRYAFYFPDPVAFWENGNLWFFAHALFNNRTVSCKHPCIKIQ